LLYARVDTVINGEEVEIFKHIPGDPRGVYRVRFTNFGEGNGSYRRVGGVVNGILYEWVGPGQGRYEPVVRLQAPQSHQMVSLQSQLQINRHVSVSGEWAVSDFDRNRFSEVGDGNNVDHAFNGGINISDIQTRLGIFSARAEQTYIGEQFEFFDRPRQIEFDRRWNIQRVTENAEESESALYMNLAGESGSSVNIHAGRLTRDLFEGTRGEAEIEIAETGLPYIYSNVSYVESRDEILARQGDWFRNRGQARNSFDLPGFEVTPFLNWETEKREQRSFPRTACCRNHFSFTT
jgi:hypothetical protein